jgi:hypothetical protein
LEEQALVAGTKQSKQHQNEAGRPNCLVSPPACFVLRLLLVLDFFSGFLWQPQTMLTRQVAHDINYYSI